MTLEDIAILQKGTEERIEGWRGEEQRKEGLDWSSMNYGSPIQTRNWQKLKEG